MGVLHQANNDYTRACEAYSGLLAADSSDVEAWYGVGECMYHDFTLEAVGGDTTKLRFRADWNRSIRAFSRVLQLDPQYHLAYQHIIDALGNCSQRLAQVGGGFRVCTADSAVYGTPDVLAPYGMNQISPMNRLKPPSLAYPFGTDNLGRDMFSRCLYGAQLSVIIGFCAAGLATIISVVLGILTGYLGGKFDLVTQRFVDAWMSFPDLVILIVIGEFTSLDQRRSHRFEIARSSTRVHRLRHILTARSRLAFDEDVSTVVVEIQRNESRDRRRLRSNGAVRVREDRVQQNAPPPTRHGAAPRSCRNN